MSDRPRLARVVRFAATAAVLCATAAGCGAAQSGGGTTAAASYHQEYREYSSDGLGPYEYVIEPNDLDTAALTNCFSTLQHQPGSIVNTWLDPEKNIVYRVDVEDLATLHYEPAPIGEMYLADTAVRRWASGLDVYLSLTLQYLEESEKSGYNAQSAHLFLRTWPRDAQRQVPLHASDVVSTLNANFYLLYPREIDADASSARADQLLREIASCTPRIIRSAS
jgi:hypothetical protein